MSRYRVRAADVAFGALAAALYAVGIVVVVPAVALTGLRRALAGQRRAAVRCSCPRGPAGHVCVPDGAGRGAGRD